MIKCDNVNCPYYILHNDIVSHKNSIGICGDDKKEVEKSCKYYRASNIQAN